MKEKELSSIIIQLNKLLLECNTLMCNTDTMENAEKNYGFYLIKIPSKKYKSGYYYAVKYKDFESKKWLSTKTSTNTDNEIQAKAFAIENRERIIKGYKEHTKMLHQKTDGKEFYKMLVEYYTDNSKYLQDDSVNNKRTIPQKDRIKHIGAIKNYFIPYFKENNINSVQEITRTVYSDLKIYLQNIENKKGEKLTTKTINNYLMILNRILQNHLRNEKIIKLPFEKGTGIIHISKEEKSKSRKPNLLPTEYLKGIFETTIEKKDGRENTLLCYMLSLIGLTAGMRPSEIGRIKVSDIKYVKDDNYFYLKAYNHKTEYYNAEETDEYRKIPLHPFVVEMLKFYIKEKNIGKEDYLFEIVNENIKQEENTNQEEDTDGHINNKKFHRSIIWLYRQIKIKEYFNKNGLDKTLKNTQKIMSIKELEKEMYERRIVFYSLRHTFNTLCVLYKYNDTDITRNDDLIDYFTGHNSGSRMRANYTQINKADKHIFYNNYGKFVIDMLNKFIFTTKEEKQNTENYATKYVDKKWSESKDLLNEDDTMDLEKVIENIIFPLVDSLKNKPTENNDEEDDIFTSV
jgi:integrase